MYKVDELSSVIAAQDEHKLRLVEAPVDAENAERAVTEDLEQARLIAEANHREASRQLEQERKEKIQLSGLLEIRDNQMSSEISDLTISRQEAALRYIRIRLCPA